MLRWSRRSIQRTTRAAARCNISSRCIRLPVIVFFDVVDSRRHVIAVVSAAIKVCIVQLHCDVSVGYTPVCPWCCKNDRKSVDWTMRWPAQVKSRSFFTIASEGVGTSTTWTGSSEVRHDARQPDGSRSLSGFLLCTLPRELSLAIVQSSRSMPPKRTVRYQQREWQQAHFRGTTLPCTFWGCGNGTKMPLLLTNDDDLVVGRSIGNAKRVGQWCARKPKINSILHDACRSCQSMVRYQLTVCVFLPS